jgi:flagellum-specific ATP synthase
LKVKKTMAIYKEAEDLINIGAYVKGSNPEID